MRLKKICSKAPLILLLFIGIDCLPLLAQEKSKTKVTIIKESYDEDGNKTVEKIVKEGPEADAIDLDKLSQGIPQERSLEFKSFGDLQEMPGFENFAPFDGGNLNDFRSFFDSLGFQGFSFFGDEFGGEGWPNFGPSDDFSVKPKLGVRINDLESETGVVVREVMPNTPAERAGLQEGDVILSVDDQTITTTSELVSYIQSRSAGDEVSIDLRRDDEHMQIVAKLTEYKPKKDIEIRKL